MFSSGCRRGILALANGGGSSFNPVSLFAAGEQGVWYDPSDFTTLFQDSAGTTPVTATGQPVGKMLDKSGRGNHMVQATAAARPVLQQDGSGFYYLQPDAVDDSMAATVDLSGTSKAWLVAGLRKTSDAASAVVCELTTSASANDGSFYLGAPDRAAASYGVATRGTVGTASGVSASSYASPISNVVSCAYDNSGGTTALQLGLRVNSVATFIADGAATSAGNFASSTFYLFARAGSSLRYGGRFYGLIVRGALTNAADMTSSEQYMGARMGIAL